MVVIWNHSVDIKWENISSIYLPFIFYELVQEKEEKKEEEEEGSSKHTAAAVVSAARRPQMAHSSRTLVVEW